MVRFAGRPSAAALTRGGTLAAAPALVRSRVAPAEDPSPADWLPGRLRPWGETTTTVGGLVPDGYAAYARLAHGTVDGQPCVGDAPAPLLSAVVEVLAALPGTPQDCWSAVWEGWTGIEAAIHGVPMFALPYRRYALFRGPLSAVPEGTIEQGGHVSQAVRPSLWWPEGGAWCVATEVDADFTLVGGTEGCIAALLARRDLVATAVGPDDEPWSGDA